MRRALSILKLRPARLVLGLVILLMLLVGWIVYTFVATYRGLPDAYAAWDAGTLLVEYLETHNGQWPHSWDDLDGATSTLDEHGRNLRGMNGNGGFIYGDIRTRVAIDWNADPEAIKDFEWGKSSPRLRVVTRADGTDFPVIWSGAEPNRMVWNYLHGMPPD